MKFIHALIAPLAMALLVSCGGSKTSPAPSPATSLSYTNPTASAGDWKLVQDATSTATRLVLNLVGPSDGTKYRGVGFTLQTDPALVKIARFRDAKGKALGYYKDAGLFLDRNSAGTADMAPSLQGGGVSEGKLMVGIFQKTDDDVWKVANGFSLDGATAKDCNGTVLQVALELDEALKAMPGDVSLTVVKAKAIPEKVDTVQTRTLADIHLQVGTLQLK